MAIANTLVVGTYTDLLTVPAGKRYAITTIMVCNTFAPNPGHEEDGQTEFDMNIVPSGQSITDQNQVINTLQLPAGETFTFDTEKIVLEAGDKVSIRSNSPDGILAATVSYMEV